MMFLGIMIGAGLCLGSDGGDGGVHILDVSGLVTDAQDVPVMGVDGMLVVMALDVVGFEVSYYLV